MDKFNSNLIRILIASLIGTIIFFTKTSPASADIANCDEQGAFVFTGKVTSCSQSQISYSTSIRNTFDLGAVDVLAMDYDIQILNSSGNVIGNITSGSALYLYQCGTVLCSAGTTVPVATASITPDLADFPDKKVSFRATAHIHVDDFGAGYTISSCNHQLTSDTCMIGGPTPSPGGCTPNATCGASGQCRPTEICNSTGNCEFQAACPCEQGKDMGCVAGSDCPPDYVCVDNTFGTGYCQPSSSCSACTDTSASCNANGQCNLIQRCIGGRCVDDPVACHARGMQIFCDKFGNQTNDSGPADNPNRIRTAIGCIPVFIMQDFTSTLLGWGVGIGGGIALILIIIGGYLVMASGGEPQKVQAGKELITASIMGLTLLLFGVFILQLVGVQILSIPNFGP